MSFPKLVMAGPLRRCSFATLAPYSAVRNPAPAHSVGAQTHPLLTKIDHCTCGMVRA